jgi:hypothetical protein
MTLLSTITDPEAFFERQSAELSLLPATGIVLLVSLLGSLLLVLPAMKAISGLSGGSPMIMYGIYVVAGVVSTVIAWMIVTAIIHFLSDLVYEGEASFRQTLAVVGWGHLPQIITGVIAAALVYYMVFVQGVPSPSSPQDIQQYMVMIQNQTLFKMANVVGIGGLLWSGYIWISGVVKVHRIEESDAFVAVAVPVVLYTALTLYGLL